METIKNWDQLLSAEFEKPYFKKLMATIEKEYQTNICFPPFDKIFNAMLLTPFEEIKCVIVGQDPYHTPGQAMGLSFSVPKGRGMQPSLQNIFKEIKSELNIDIPSHGDLTAWARRGVLLLNSVLTVRSHAPASHQNLGWETFGRSAESDQPEACARGLHALGELCPCQGQIPRQPRAPDPGIAPPFTLFG